MAQSKKKCCLPEKSKRHSRLLCGTKADEDLFILSKALGHPIRVKILRLLIQKQSCICGEIVEEITLAQSTISQHLKILKDSGLIRGEIEGTSTCYCIDSQGLRRFKALIAAL